ncbi:MAG: hypothetical protein CMJ49_07510 [Planctomycetaceae bacterium]|nr:hypothetical protein [Planctomycetaceae bacterium]
MPARSTRWTTWPIRPSVVSEPADPNSDTLETKTVLLNSAGAVLDQRSGQMSLDTPRERTVTLKDEEDELGITVVQGCREVAGYTHRVARLSSAIRVPRFEPGWDQVDTFVLLRDQPSLDPRQQAMLRHWLKQGGTLLVWANEVDAEAMGVLLGEPWTLSAFDAVTLNQADFELMGATSGGGRVRAWDEAPYKMVRALTPGFETHISVRGWGALVSRPVGEGRLIVSTLEPRAWLHDGASDALAHFSSMLYRVRTRRAEVSGAVAGPYLASQLGYGIASRGRIGVVLLGYLGIFIVVSVGLSRLERREWTGPAGLVLALAAAIGLLAARQETNETLTAGALQLIAYDQTTQVVQGHGWVGLNDPAGAGATVRGGGYQRVWTLPGDASSQSASRMVWADTTDWRWSDLELRAGAVRMLQFDRAGPMAAPWELRLRFGRDGLIGSIGSGANGLPDDLLIATDMGWMRPRVQKGPDGLQIKAGIGEALDPGMLHMGTTITPSAVRHGDVMADLLGQGMASGGPLVMGWTTQMDAGVTTEPAMTAKAETLWSMPMVIERAARGTEVTIPWPLVELERRPRDLPGSIRASHLFNPSLREWNETPRAATVALRFVIPEAVRPLGLTAATLHLDIKALQHEVVVSSHDGQSKRELFRRRNVDGSEDLTLPIDQVFVDGADRILILLDVTPRVDDAIWQIQHVGLTLQGAVGSGK